MCLPRPVISKYLNLRQPSLQRLGLITDGSCPFWIDPSSTSHIPSLTSLRSLSWRCIAESSSKEQQMLESLVKRNANHLENLTLQQINTDPDPEDPDMIPTWPRDLLLELLSQKQTHIQQTKDSDPCVPLFPSLQNLSLCMFNFEGKGPEFCNLFDPSLLSNLKLWSCDSGHRILSALATSKQKLGLRHLEYSGVFPHTDYREHNGMLDLLESFRGLQDLFIHSERYTDWPSMFDAIVQNHSGIERLVAHPDESYSNMDWQAELSPSDDALTSHPYMLPKLRCLGVCISETSHLRGKLVSFLFVERVRG